ncbi:MAG TPA: hypothetical protein VGF74_02695 [Thermoleophilaceae bacterium]
MARPPRWRSFTVRKLTTGLVLALGLMAGLAIAAYAGQRPRSDAIQAMWQALVSLFSGDTFNVLPYPPSG